MNLTVLIGNFQKQFDSWPACKLLSRCSAEDRCLSSQSEVAKPLAGWHAKSLTTLKSGALSRLSPKPLITSPNCVTFDRVRKNCILGTKLKFSVL